MLEFCSKELIIYTDGACKNNPGPGGWAALLIYDKHEKIITGYEQHTTNNRMELSAVMHALEVVKYPCKIEVYTDSIYVQRGITEWLPKWRLKQWRTSGGTKVKNRDLWERLDLAVKQHNIGWNWVKAHNGDPLNERVDCLARQAIICGK